MKKNQSIPNVILNVDYEGGVGMVQELIPTSVTDGHNHYLGEEGIWRAIDIHFAGKKSMRDLWGIDIWVQDVPMLKVGIAANVIMWILLWVTR
jgi:hypothetical protein